MTGENFRQFSSFMGQFVHPVGGEGLGKGGGRGNRYFSPLQVSFY